MGDAITIIAAIEAGKARPGRIPGRGLWFGGLCHSLANGCHQLVSDVAGVGIGGVGQHDHTHLVVDLGHRHRGIAGITAAVAGIGLALEALDIKAQARTRFPILVHAAHAQGFAPRTGRKHVVATGLGRAAEPCGDELGQIVHIAGHARRGRHALGIHERMHPAGAIGCAVGVGRGEAGIEPIDAAGSHVQRFQDISVHIIGPSLAAHLLHHQPGDAKGEVGIFPARLRREGGLAPGHQRLQLGLAGKIEARPMIAGLALQAR